MAFSLEDIMRQENKQKKAGDQLTAPKVQMLHYSKLYKSDGQFYSEDQIEELAEMILLGKGIKQPLLVKRSRSEIGKYEIIAGHRRRLAAIHLYEHGHEEYAFLPCIVSKDDDITDKMNLILTNRSQRRDLSAFELMKEINELHILIKEYEEQSGEKVTARLMRKEIAKALGISETKVANLQNIDRNLSDQGKAKLEKGDINISVATELAGLPEEKQDALMEKEDLSVKDVKEAKKEEKNVSDSDTKALECDGNCFFCEDSNCQFYIDKRELCLHDKSVHCSIYGAKEVAEDMGINCRATCCMICREPCEARCNYSVKELSKEYDADSVVSESDTKLGTEEMPKGQVWISDYNGIAPGEFSRAEKLEAIKEALACLAHEKERAENIIHEFDYIDDDTRMILAKYTVKKEAFELYRRYLRSEIRE